MWLCSTWSFVYCGIIQCKSIAKVRNFFTKETLLSSYQLNSVKTLECMLGWPLWGAWLPGYSEWPACAAGPPAGPCRSLPPSARWFCRFATFLTTSFALPPNCRTNFWLFYACLRILKGIDRSFELRGESRLIWSVMTNWRLSNFFNFVLRETTTWSCEEGPSK